ncbi:galectin-8-like [Ciona intestinalis]
MSQPAIENPVIPFTEHVNGVFRGRSFVISGTVLPNATRFSVNLMYGVDNIGFHFNPRFNEGNIVLCNNRVNGEWQTDERTPPGKFPFKSGEGFTMMILFTERKIKVFVNQKHLLGFKHRVELYKISSINIEGEVSVRTLSFGMLGNYPDTGIEIPEPAVDTLVAVPYPNIKFHDVTFIGRPRGMFSINFLGKDSNEIVLHINPRFKENQIVRNSLLDNQWGNEDRSLEMDFPFTPNAPFMVMVKVDKKGFTVMLNGFHLFHFAHRFKPLRKIRSVDFRGDVDMHKIIFN